MAGSSPNGVAEEMLVRRQGGVHDNRLGERGLLRIPPDPPRKQAGKRENEHDERGQGGEVATVDHDQALVASRRSSCHSRNAV